MNQKCILICDDDKDILDVCKLILEKNNYSVKTAATCEDVFLYLTAIIPDLILMDLWAPIMGGEAAIAKLKGDDKTKNIPVILFSAHNKIEKISEKSGADGFIQKPFEMQELLEKIRLQTQPS